MINYTQLGYDNYLSIQSYQLNNNITNANVDSIVSSGAVSFDKTTMNNLLPGQDMASSNFVSGVSGWQLKGDGDSQLYGLILVGGTLKYGKASFTDSTNAGYILDVNGIYIGSVSDTTYIKYDISGATLIVKANIQTEAGSVIETSYLSGIVDLSNTNISAQGWTSTLTFSSTDYNTVAWTSGTITTAAGTAYSINSGNTGNMAGVTYIYLDIGVSTTALQTTTIAATAIGSGKVLIAVASPNTDTTSDASVQVFGGTGGQILNVDNLAANSASTNEFVANTANIANAIITNAKIADLDVSKLTAGTITSKAITLAVLAGQGDSKIQAGKTSFGDTTAGFILGIDQSDGDKAKFEIGDSTDYLKWTGSGIEILCSKEHAITVTYGSDIFMHEGGDMKFQSVSSPTACTASLIETSGNLNEGNYKYKIAYVTSVGITNLGSVSNTVTTDSTHKQVSLTSIPTSLSQAVIERRIYRTNVGGSEYFYIATLSDNTTTTYTDNIADSGVMVRSFNHIGNTTFGKIIIDNKIGLNTSTANTFTGLDSGTDNTSGYYNTATGVRALLKNTTGHSNSALGHQALRTNTTGTLNNAFGQSALYSNTTGMGNVAIGVYSLLFNTKGNNNIAMGFESLYNNTTGNSNVALSQGAMRSNTDGGINIAIGGQSLYNNTTGHYNIAIGFQALYTSSTASKNIAIGNSALYYTTGTPNIAIGENAGKVVSTGNYNVLIGNQAGYSITTGNGNTAVGCSALDNETTGLNNSALGYHSLGAASTGGYNVGIGYYGGGSILTGTGNTFVGYNAGYDASQKTDASNSAGFGKGAYTVADNEIKIGNSAVTKIGGQVGWTTYSDKRGKTRIKNYNHGLDLIMKLRPVQFYIKDDKTNKKHSGFIAQEVEKIGIPFHGLHKPVSKKDRYALSYEEFVVPLVNAIQQQQKEINELKNIINKLKCKNGIKH